MGHPCKFGFADLSGDILSDISAVSGYIALGEDIRKLEYQIFEPKAVKDWNKAVQADYGKAKANGTLTKDGKWEYWEGANPSTVNLPDVDNPNNYVFPWQDGAAVAGGDGGAHFRSRLFHAVTKDNITKIHRNQFPSLGLFGALGIPHAFLEGRISDIKYISRGWLSDGIDWFRWQGLAAGTAVYNNRGLYRPYLFRY